MPVTAFCEWTAEADPATGRKAKVWFARPGGEPFAFAGVIRPMPEGAPARFAFLTCEPNALVGAVHPKAMPVVLTGEGVEAWMQGAPAAAFALPCAEDHLTVVAT